MSPCCFLRPINAPPVPALNLCRLGQGGDPQESFGAVRIRSQCVG